MKPQLRWGIVIMLLAVILGMAAWLIWTDKLPASQVLSGDTDGNGQDEKYILNEHQMQVWEDSKLIWQAPKEWQIKQIVTADADNDGNTELLLLLWKKGSFGKSKPFWFKGSDNELTCHIFVYRLAAGKMKAVWCSSALDHPILKLSVKDSGRDGLNELQVTEGPRIGFAYRLRQYFSRQHTRWIWNGWGFERADESPQAV